jgi:YVTN family beta-propeller protein
VYDITGDAPKQTATIPMKDSVYWLTWSPDGKTAYVAVRGADEVAVVDTESKKVTASVPAGKVPKRLLIVTVPEKKEGR